MVTEDEDDAEGALLEGLRLRLGSDVPIMVTVDLHANVSERMVRHCNGLLAFKTYPHVDQRDVGFEACQMLQTAMQSGARATVHIWQLPTLVGCDFGRSDGTVMPELLRLARDIQGSDRRCQALEVCAGFPWSDVAFAGPSVVMTWANSAQPPCTLVAPLLDAIWATRKTASVHCVSSSQAVTLAKSWQQQGPLVLADVADNPGAGGLWRLRRLAESTTGCRCSGYGARRHRRSAGGRDRDRRGSRCFGSFGAWRPI